ncbi:hypothetical protein GE09DRAFT_204445 [Coniochaeta sp. 2T2.1]|nr:hypothetical protein GE09DRAFT_204445 [Coniochaeta sp. 2T2.1]
MSRFLPPRIWEKTLIFVLIPVLVGCGDSGTTSSEVTGIPQLQSCPGTVDRQMFLASSALVGISPSKIFPRINIVTGTSSKVKKFCKGPTPLHNSQSDAVLWHPADKKNHPISRHNPFIRSCYFRPPQHIDTNSSCMSQRGILPICLKILSRVQQLHSNTKASPVSRICKFAVGLGSFRTLSLEGGNTNILMPGVSLLLESMCVMSVRTRQADCL